MDTKPTKPLSLILNTLNTQYEIVTQVATSLKWKTSTDENEDWDVLWTDSAVTPERLTKMKHYQRINHFPSMYLISRKNFLAINITKLKRLFPEAYDFFPRTWIFPCDINDLKIYMHTQKNPYVIVKPEASSQGRGIFLTNRVEDIRSDDKFVVQEYINPFLIDGLKFDLRIYVLITSCDPLRIFIFKEGLTRFATETYQKPCKKNSENMYIHLTNYAVNKTNPNFINNKSTDKTDVGHKRDLHSTFAYLASQGYNTDLLKEKIEEIIIKTICCVQTNLSHNYNACQPEDLSKSMCFEILGFDIMLDSSLKPFLLEVNHSPSFNTDSPLDKLIKSSLISQSLKLAMVSVKNRSTYYKKFKESVIKRAVSGKLERILPENKKKAIDAIGAYKDLYETRHLGSFKKIYPVQGWEIYQEYIQAASEEWSKWTGAKSQARSRSVKETTQLSSSKPNKSTTIKIKAALAEAFNCTVFERLSQPIVRKAVSHSQYVPGVVYSEKRKLIADPTPQVSHINYNWARVKTEERQVNDFKHKAIPIPMRKKSVSLKDLFLSKHFFSKSQIYSFSNSAFAKKYNI